MGCGIYEGGGFHTHHEAPGNRDSLHPQSPAKYCFGNFLLLARNMPKSANILCIFFSKLVKFTGILKIFFIFCKIRSKNRKHSKICISNEKSCNLLYHLWIFAPPPPDFSCGHPLTSRLDCLTFSPQTPEPCQRMGSRGWIPLAPRGSENHRGLFRPK